MAALEKYRERFAESGWEVFGRAVEEALRRGQKQLGVEHVLYALVELKAEYFLSMLRSLFENPDAIKMLEGLIEERVQAARRHEGPGVRLAAETIDLFKRTLRRVRWNGRQRMEATDLFITLVMEEKSLLRELLGELLADPEARSKHVKDLFTVVESVGAASRPSTRQKYKYLKDEMVRIKSGPFASFTGRVETVDEENSTLTVLVFIMGRDQPVELRFIDAEKIDLAE